MSIHLDETKEDREEQTRLNTCFVFQPTLLSLRKLEQDWNFSSHDKGCWVDATSDKETPGVSLSAVAYQHVVWATCREYASSNGQLVSVLWSQGTIELVDGEP
eukprot:scaffold898_cov168-Amphora_coffeaeformis.AAC.11